MPAEERKPSAWKADGRRFETKEAGRNAQPSLMYMCSGAGNGTRTRDPLLGKAWVDHPLLRPPSESGNAPFANRSRWSPNCQLTLLYPNSPLIQANSLVRRDSPEVSHFFGLVPSFSFAEEQHWIWARFRGADR